MKDDEIALLLEVVLQPEKPLATLDERVQRLDDVRALTDLVMAYGWLCDQRRWPELLDLYADDFVRVLAGTLDERATKADMMELYERPVLPRAGAGDGPPDVSDINSYELRHLIHPPVVRVDGDEAVVATVYSLVATSGDGSTLRRGEHEGGYIFRFRREPDVGWRFTVMTVISENARNPLFQA